MVEGGFIFISVLTEGPGVARGKIIFEKKILTKKFSNFFLAFNTLRPPMSIHKKFQPNQSSRLTGYREHIYECLVLLYRFDVFVNSLNSRLKSQPLICGMLLMYTTHGDGQ